MLKRIKAKPQETTFNSYLALLKYGNTQKVRQAAWQEFILNQSPEA
jgi:hypothetical protein